MTGAVATVALPDTGAPDASFVRTRYVGTRGGMFKLAFVTGLLTVLTLGFYRFWMKTRLRRYYWSSIRPGGVPLEYMGQPLEKLLGFLIAVVFLAFYIGIVNLILMFAAFAIFHGNVTAYVLSFVGLLPLWFYARYRARRYILARTRWRGIRFGLEPGAWGYAFRALMHWAITILSLGFLWPRMTFALEKYRTDRTYFGSVRLEQAGRWTQLYRHYLHVALPALATLLILGITFYLVDTNLGDAELLDVFEAIDDGDVAPGTFRLLPLLGITLPWIGFGVVYYAVNSFRYLTDHKRAGPLRFEARPRTGRMVWVYMGGYGLTYMVLLGGLVVLGIAALLIVVPMIGGSGGEVPDFLTQNPLGDLPLWLTTGLSIVAYFTIFILWGVFEHVFVTLPRARHYAETLTLFGVDGLVAVAQRDRDEFTEAEGFADALDLGAAI